MIQKSLGIAPARFSSPQPFLIPHACSSHCDHAISLAEDNELDMRKTARKLSEAGFSNVLHLHDLHQLAIHMSSNPCSLLILSINIATDVDQTLSFLAHMRNVGFRGMIAMTAHTTTKELFFRAAVCGANDFLIKGKYLDIATEIERLLKCKSNTSYWNPDNIGASGFFRSLGLTKSEMALLVEFARDFSDQKSLANRIRTSEPGVRKSFSRIYKKISRVFKIENSAQLSHILTICSLYA